MFHINDEFSQIKKTLILFYRTESQYGIMEFSNNLSSNIQDWKTVEMRREYDREQKKPLTPSDCDAKETNIENPPWLLTGHSSKQKKRKHYRGLKKCDITENSSYYVCVAGEDGCEAHHVEDWYAFTPTSINKTVDDDDDDDDNDDDDANNDEDILDKGLNFKQYHV